MYKYLGESRHIESRLDGQIDRVSSFSYQPCYRAVFSESILLPLIHIALLYWSENNIVYGICQIHKLQLCCLKQKTIISGQGSEKRVLAVREAAGEKKRLAQLSTMKQQLLIGIGNNECMNESCFPDGVMAVKLLRGMLVLCAMWGFPSASASPRSLGCFSLQLPHLTAGRTERIIAHV